MSEPCTCSICRARELGVDSWQIMWGLDSLESRLFAEKPGLPIYHYEKEAKRIRAEEAALEAMVNAELDKFSMVSNREPTKEEAAHGLSLQPRAEGLLNKSWWTLLKEWLAKRMGW